MKKDSVILIVKEDVSFFYTAIINMIITIFYINFEAMFPRHNLILLTGVAPVNEGLNWGSGVCSIR